MAYNSLYNGIDPLAPTRIDFNVGVIVRQHVHYKKRTASKNMAGKYMVAKSRNPIKTQTVLIGKNFKGQVYGVLNIPFLARCKAVRRSRLNELE